MGGVMFEGGILCVRIVHSTEYSLKEVFAPSPSYCHVCRYQRKAMLAQVKLCESTLSV